MGKPYLPNIDAIIAAGINPKTGLPFKLTDDNIKPEIKKILRILDEQDAVNRYVWKNIPACLTSQELERLIYYKGQLVLFYHPDLKEFYFLPYALNGTIDVYGRYNTVKPVPIANGVEESEETNKKILFSTLSLDVVRKPILNPTKEQKLNSGVLLWDYTKQISETTLPRYALQDAIIDCEAECIPYMRTNLQIASGVKPTRVNDADQAKSMTDASKSLKKAALSGEALVPFGGAVEVQELFDGSSAQAEEFMMAMQSLDNFRLRCLGVKSSGVFEKKAHTLGSEQEMNEAASSSQLNDGLAIRKSFCDIVNSIWAVGIDVEIADNGENDNGHQCNEEDGEKNGYFKVQQ